MSKLNLNLLRLPRLRPPGRVFWLVTAVVAAVIFKILATPPAWSPPPISTQAWEAAQCPNCNVVLISMTNLRYDHISAHGYTRPTTPNLDRLMGDSLDFTSAFSQSSWTLPEAISIMTSLYPYQHGVMDRYDSSRLSPQIPALPDQLKQAGYATAAVTGRSDHLPETGLFNRFDSSYGCLTTGEIASHQNTVTVPPPNNPAATEEIQYGEFSCSIPWASSWVKDHVKDKFFLHVQGFDAHCPFSQKGGKTYDPSYQGKIDYSNCLMTFGKTDPVIKGGQPYYQVYDTGTGLGTPVLLSERDVSHLVALYDESITAADREVGKLIDQLKASGLYDETIIVVTSEHGDLFGEHGRFMRGGPLQGTFYDEVLHVPLIIRHPKLASRQVKGLVSLLDIAPTILDFLGLPGLKGAAGRSLVPLLRDGRTNPYELAGSDFHTDANNIYFQKNSRIESIRTEDWRLIIETIFDSNGFQTTSRELYQIKDDPGEKWDLSQAEPKVRSDLEKILVSWSQQMRK